LAHKNVYHWRAANHTENFRKHQKIFASNPAKTPIHAHAYV